MARITIVLDDKLLFKLRDIQSKKMQTSVKTVSFSSIVNEQLAEHLKVNLD